MGGSAEPGGACLCRKRGPLTPAAPGRPLTRARHLTPGTRRAHPGLPGNLTPTSRKVRATALRSRKVGCLKRPPPPSLRSGVPHLPASSLAASLSGPMARRSHPFFSGNVARRAGSRRVGAADGLRQDPTDLGRRRLFRGAGPTDRLSQRAAAGVERTAAGGGGTAHVVSYLTVITELNKQGGITTT
jgi:hypothetical protein